MPNSTAQVNVLLQILDGLNAANQPLFTHQVPPVAYSGSPQSSLTQSTASSYVTLNPGSTLNLCSDPPVSPFLFVRNAGTTGIATITTVTEQAPSQGSVFLLNPGGIFLFANNLYSGAPNPNYIISAILGAQGTSPVVIEYLLGV